MQDAKCKMQDGAVASGRKEAKFPGDQVPFLKSAPEGLKLKVER